jgi:hypothetical protein
VPGGVALVVLVVDVAVGSVVVVLTTVVVVVTSAWVVVVVPLLPFPEPDEEDDTDRCVPGTWVEPFVSFTGWGWVGSACAAILQSWSSSLKSARPM